MESVHQLDCAGRPRSAATLASFHRARPPANTRLRYLSDPPTIGEIIAVMRAPAITQKGGRVRGLIIVL